MRTTANILATTIVITLLVTEVASAQTQRACVFGIAGQSNMDGRADINNAPSPPDWSIAQEDVFFYHNTAEGWEPLHHGTASPPGTKDSFGPELSLGRYLRDNHPDCDEIGLVKKAGGGASLSFAWFPGTGQYYTYFISVINNFAIPELETIGYTVVFKGVLWIEGENDALDQDDALAYEANLTLFISSVRADLGIPDLPFAIARIHVPPSFLYGDIVRNAQDAVAAADPFVNTFSTDHLTQKADNVHFDAQGQIGLGMMFAQSIIQLDSEAQAVPALGKPGWLAMFLGITLVAFTGPPARCFTHI